MTQTPQTPTAPDEDGEATTVPPTTDATTDAPAESDGIVESA